MELKEVQVLVENANKNLETLKKEIEGKASNITALEKKYDDLTAKIEALPDGKVAEQFKSDLLALETKLKDIKIQTPEGKKSQEQKLVELFTSDNFKALQKKAVNGPMGQDWNGEVKANEITTSGSMTSSTGTLIIGQETEPLVARVPWRTNPIWNLIDKGVVGANKNSVGWVERNSQTSGAAMKAENVAFGQSLATFVKNKVDVKKVTDYIKITREDMEDTDFIISEVMDLLNNQIPRLRENQLLTGSGIGDNIRGILSTGTPYAKAFAVPSGVKPSSSIVSNYDVLMIAITQVMLGNTGLVYGQGFRPTAIFMNPVDITNMRLIKDSIGQYVFPAFLGMNEVPIAGIPVVECFDITAGTFMVGAFDKAKAFVKRDLQIRMWEQNEDDALRDVVTFTASQRLAFRIKDIETYGFVYGTFASAQALVSADL